MRSLYVLLLLASMLMSCSSEPDNVAQEDFCADIGRSDDMSLSETLKPFAARMQRETGVHVLEDGGGALTSRAWFTAHAEKTIDIQYFIFSTDNIGLIGIDYLVRAADRGIKVRILVDDLLVDAEIDDILKMDYHENISIRIYNPGVNLGKNIVQKLTKFATEFQSANMRMHNKTFIVDDMVAITGGRNLADEYFDYDHEYNFRDRDVLLLGKVVGDMNASFEAFWNSEYSVPVTSIAQAKERPGAVSYANLHQYACNPDNFWPQARAQVNQYHETLQNMFAAGHIVWLDRVAFVSDLPGKNEARDGRGNGNLTTAALVELVNQAEQSIDIQTPYLVTTDFGKNLMRSAVERGVAVRILTNSIASTDNLEAFSGYQRDRVELLNTGVRIFEFRPDAASRKELLTGVLQRAMDFTPRFGLHAKSMVVDGQISVIGTFNLDPRSANLNTECMAIIHSTEIAARVLREMEREFRPENSWETTLDFNPDDTVGKVRQIRSWTRKIVPKGVL